MKRISQIRARKFIKIHAYVAKFYCIAVESARGEIIEAHWLLGQIHGIVANHTNTNARDSARNTYCIVKQKAASNKSVAIVRISSPENCLFPSHTSHAKTNPFRHLNENFPTAGFPSIFTVRKSITFVHFCITQVHLLNRASIEQMQMHLWFVEFNILFKDLDACNERRKLFFFRSLNLGKTKRLRKRNKKISERLLLK